MINVRQAIQQSKRWSIKDLTKSQCQTTANVMEDGDQSRALIQRLCRLSALKAPEQGSSNEQEPLQAFTSMKQFMEYSKQLDTDQVEPLINITHEFEKIHDTFRKVGLADESRGWLADGQSNLIKLALRLQDDRYHVVNK
ncbi:hypothetical protein MIR68_008179 [Amoeboaphelidium protococcarum]|nr:hypothetical protein MIR68_008179 [Amoeboaphelidium protococcarum]